MKENTTDSIETAEEYRQATAEEQILYHLQLKSYREIKERDDVEKVFEIRAGKPPETRRRADKRRKVQIFDTPAGYFEYVGDEAYTYTELHDERPDEHLITRGVEKVVEHRIREHNTQCRRAFEIIHARDEELASDVREDLLRFQN